MPQCAPCNITNATNQQGNPVRVSPRRVDAHGIGNVIDERVAEGSAVRVAQSQPVNQQLHSHPVCCKHKTNRLGNKIITNWQSHVCLRGIQHRGLCILARLSPHSRRRRSEEWDWCCNVATQRTTGIQWAFARMAQTLTATDQVRTW